MFQSKKNPNTQNMSSNETHCMDPSTGLKVEILHGPGNYTRWQRDIKLVAEYKGLWNLIDPLGMPENDIEGIFPKPVRPTRLDASIFRAAVTASAQQIATSHQSFCFDCDSF